MLVNMSVNFTYQLQPYPPFITKSFHGYSCCLVGVDVMRMTRRGLLLMT